MTIYEELREAAESGNREDINALGRWFEREGREFWNGECYHADGMELYPLYKLVDAECGDYDVVGYTTDKTESINSAANFWDSANEIINAGNYDAAVALMDDEIREAVHADLAPCTELEFLMEYLRRHMDRYGKAFCV